MRQKKQIWLSAAVSEGIELKINVCRKVETVKAKDAILATNIITLDINQIADALNNPRRLIGLHFFKAGTYNETLKIIRGHQSSKKYNRLCCSQSSKKNSGPIWSLRRLHRKSDSFFPTRGCGHTTTYWFNTLRS